MMVRVAAIPDGAHVNNVSHLMALCGGPPGASDVYGIWCWDHLHIQS